ncbi:ATP-binding cassette domain-containing protein [Aquibacillus rhizosphaerae]|uniref:ATP-binding cassette domain-containing protein n=1 Tax=Aquibacillus rhizosphaerae TaxID=3051431 RepID=A0ABT7L267_9BACI|nr:ATP-binding cassette domain-containing protein [Aquibacillus sp. LR5S19]MDL4839494.1 ATP-binding cassette domain-containing protein [Aquibacillus sp. LR5S19]
MEKIQLKNINKQMKRKDILQNINLDIHGSLGLLGPNGAGKTTLMKIITTLIQPDSGTIQSENLNWENTKEVRKNIGYLPQHFSMYKNITVRECLNHLGNLKGISMHNRSKDILTTAENVNLIDVLDTKIKNLSGGMLRRVGIAQAILGNPKLLIVDEPTVGLDIEERVRFRRLLRKLGRDRHIIISTHIVEDIETTCDSICILKDGKVLQTGSKSDLLDLVRGKVVEDMVDLNDTYLESLRLISTREAGNQYKIRYFSDSVNQNNIVEPALEDAYLYLMKEEDTNDRR